MKQNFGPTDINQVVARTIKLVQNEVPAHLTLEVQLAEQLPAIDADDEQLKQVLINLVQNAIQAMGDRPGRIRVRTSGPERYQDLRGGPEFVEVEVVDEGPGIPSDQQPHIFVPFYTTKQTGTGLGLAICQRIVKSHGGSISVQSRAAEGSAFLVRLPAIGPEPAAQRPADATPVPGETQPPRTPIARARRRSSA
jgi:two-component system, NtrC family, sensor histidine kinase HydH